MTALKWNPIDNQNFVYGVDHGVFFPEDGPGVPWNGLISVSESYVGGETTPYYFDGQKYLDVAAPKNFQAAVQAFAPPPGFGPCDGEREIVPGFIVTRQKRKRFSFSYRTKIGNTGHYLIHLVYNATATRNGVVSNTRSRTAETPTIYDWQIDAVPPTRLSYEYDSEFFRPTAHVSLSSKDAPIGVMFELQKVLYGSEITDPYMPGLADLRSFENIIYGGNPYRTGPLFLHGGVPKSAGIGRTVTGGTPDDWGSVGSN